MKSWRRNWQISNANLCRTVKNQNSFLSNIGLNLGQVLTSLTLHHSLQLLIFTVLYFAGLSQVSSSDYPSFRPILPKIYLILIFHSPYSSITSMLKLSKGISSIKESSINTVLLLCLNSSIRAGSQMGTAKSRC